MKSATPTSYRNRTGLQMSPSDSRFLIADDDEPIDIGSGSADLRGQYMAEAEAIGSIPAPGTLRGVARASLQALAGRRMQVLVDKLGERMAFERSGVRLYAALIAKCDAMQPDPGRAPFPPPDLLRRILHEEAEHYHMLVDAIQSLGGDPTAQTPAADLVGIEGAGLIQVLTDPRTTLTQSLHAMLTAELVDNAGWDLLLTLAESCEQKELMRRFEIALAEEAAHLRLVHDWHAEATLSEARLRQG